MTESIQCWQCGARMTLEELASNDGDCPECDVEVHLAEYLSKALAEIAELRAQLPSQGGEAVAEYQQLSRYRNWDRIDKVDFDLGMLGSCPEKFRALYTRPADQVVEGVAVSRKRLEHWADKLEDSESSGYGWEDALAAELRALLNGGRE